MKLQFSIHGNLKKVKNFRQGRYLVDDILSDEIKQRAQKIESKIGNALNNGEPALRDPRLIAAIGSTQYWHANIVKGLKGTKKDTFLQLEIINSQPDGMYYARRPSKDSPTGFKEIAVPVGNLALVRMYPPKKAIYPKLNSEAPSPYLTFYVNGKYIKTKVVHPGSGHERYRNYILGTVKQILIDEIDKR